MCPDPNCATLQYINVMRIREKLISGVKLDHTCTFHYNKYNISGRTNAIARLGLLHLHAYDLIANLTTRCIHTEYCQVTPCSGRFHCVQLLRDSISHICVLQHFSVFTCMFADVGKHTSMCMYKLDFTFIFK